MQAYPRITLAGAQMYESKWWRKVAATWEIVIYNPVFDLETWGLPLIVVAAVAVLALRYRRKWLHLLPWPWPVWWRTRRKPSDGGRDLSV
jgi:hypothetical protein